MGRSGEDFPFSGSFKEKTPCVVPVAACDALAWAAGRLKDSDLLLNPPEVPEAVFVVDLPDRASYRTMLDQVKHWHAAGAVFLIARTGTPIVDKHMELKNGCIRVFKETHSDPPKWRFVAPPDVFNRWLGRWSPHLKDSANASPAPSQGPSQRQKRPNGTKIELPPIGEPEIEQIKIRHIES